MFNLFGPKKPLYQAVQENDLDAVHRCLSKGANPNSYPADMDPPLYSTGDERIARALLAKGADPDACRPARNPPLSRSILHGWPDIFETLLAFGANPNKRNGIQETALHLAVVHGDAKMVQRLLFYGAYPRLLDSLGRSPHDLAWLFGKRDMQEILALYTPETESIEPSAPPMPEESTRDELPRPRGGVECGICYGTGENRMAAAHCGHVYCKECWSKTIRNTRRCPECRKPVSLAELIILYL